MRIVSAVKYSNNIKPDKIKEMCKKGACCKTCKYVGITHDLQPWLCLCSKDSYVYYDLLTGIETPMVLWQPCRDVVGTLDCHWEPIDA